jgi:hypothetical protein
VSGEEGIEVKVLLAIDGSSYSETAIAEVAHRPWRADTEVLVLTVVIAPSTTRGCVWEQKR